MKKVIFIGQTGSGKTTLCQKLNEQTIRYRKTQAVERFAKSIDTPGEYLENPRFYSALAVTAVDADVVALVADPTRSRQAIPPGFAAMFTKEVIGIVTKIHQATTEAVENAKKELLRAKASPVFLVDTPEGTGIRELFDYLEQKGGEKE